MSGDDGENDRTGGNSSNTPRSPPPPPLQSKVSLPLEQKHHNGGGGAKDRYSDESDDEEEGRGGGEVQELVNLSGGNQSMSIGTSDDSSDEYSSRRWRTTAMRSQLSNGENDYEYDYLDEDVLGRRVCVVPSFKLRLLFGVFIVASVLAISIPNNRKREENMARKYKGAPQYVCPAIPLTAATMTTTTEHDDYSSHIFANYGNNSALIQQITANLTEYTKTFRKLEYMDWNKTYNQVKEGMKHWKVSRYLPNIKTGDSIFESGCGIGLGLLLTVELLQDENIRDLHLYGTDFGGTAATTANGLLDAVLTEAASVGGGKRGAVCTADSTRLSFIPDNSFDFVFAGRISPVLDPWETNATASATTNATIARHREICATKATDWRSQMLYDLALERQSAWYGKWVSEMVRIAKPGVPLAIEQVSDPYCDDQQMDERGGGVPHAFWQEGIATYGWDVDPESIDFESDVLFPDKHRYHVFMRKRRRLAD